MPQPVSFNTGNPVSGSIQESIISYVVDGQQRDYRGGYNGLAWMSEAPATNNVIFIGNTTNVGRGPANTPLFYPSFNNSEANIVYAANKLPGSPGNFSDTASAYDYAIGSGFFINNSNSPIPRIDADELTFYVEANQPGSYPGVNNTWYDISGRGNNGDLLNGTTWNSEGWFEFDGVDDRVRTLFGFQNNNESHEAWIYSKGNVSTYNMFLGIILPYYGFFNGNTFIIQDSIGGAQVGYYTGTLSLDRWYHFLSTRNYDGTNTTLTTYINGTLSAQQTYSGAPGAPGGTWAIGNWDAPSAGASYPFYGDISGVKIYTQTLTAAQVKQNYFQSNIVTDGLIFMVDANNIVSYPKSAARVYNLIGGNRGDLINGVGFINNNGGTWTFDGVDDYINIPYSSSQNLTSQGTISVWINPATITQGSFAGLVAQCTGGGVNQQAYQLSWRQVSNALYGAICNGSGTYNEIFASLPTTANIWYNIVFTWNGSILSMYNNGTLLSQTTQTINNQVLATDLTIGGFTYKGAGGGGEPFNGQIANVELYNRGFTAAEIQQNYQATKDKFLGQNIVTNGLVLNLDSANKDSYPGTGTIWTDLTGVAGNSILYNGVGFNSNLWGGSLSFDSVDDYSRITNPNVTLGTNPRTLIGWFRATSSVYGCIFGFGNAPSGTPTYGSMELWNYADPLAMHYAGGSISSGLSLSANLNKWLMAVLKFDGTTAYIQIIDNGTSYSNSATVPLNTYAANFSINKSAYANEGGGLAGYWGTALLYNRALSPTEITQVYNATKGRFGI
jgi:hypothetical protein